MKNGILINTSPPYIHRYIHNYWRQNEIWYIDVMKGLEITGFPSCFRCIQVWWLHLVPFIGSSTFCIYPYIYVIYVCFLHQYSGKTIFNLGYNLREKIDKNISMIFLMLLVMRIARKKVIYLMFFMYFMDMLMEFSALQWNDSNCCVFFHQRSMECWSRTVCCLFHSHR